ncbi:MAG: hypothetical protein H0S80_04105 [Desulfovibrionaceae bacterium]|nr:hypothetical protein [Desulfovibrionaceae bacterium]
MDKIMLTPTESLTEASKELVEMYSAVFFLKGAVSDIADNLSEVANDDCERLNGIAQVLNLILGQIETVSDLVKSSY